MVILGSLIMIKLNSIAARIKEDRMLEIDRCFNEINNIFTRMREKRIDVRVQSHDGDILYIHTELYVPETSEIIRRSIAIKID